MSQSLSRLSDLILSARLERDAAVTPESFRRANIRVTAAFEAWRTIALKGKN